MRVEKVKGFEPISIILETQEEVDKVFALFNNTIINNAIELSNWWDALSKYRSNNFAFFHNKLCNIIKE